MVSSVPLLVLYSSSWLHMLRHLKLKHLLLISAKATFDAISKTYSYLTPDLWKETVFTKSPYQVRFNHNFISWLVI